MQAKKNFSSECLFIKLFKIMQDHNFRSIPVRWLRGTCLSNRKPHEVRSSISLNNVNDFAMSVTNDGNTVTRHIYLLQGSQKTSQLGAVPRIISKMNTARRVGYSTYRFRYGHNTERYCEWSTAPVWTVGKRYT